MGKIEDKDVFGILGVGELRPGVELQVRRLSDDDWPGMRVDLEEWVELPGNRRRLTSSLACQVIEEEGKSCLLPRMIRFDLLGQDREARIYWLCSEEVAREIKDRGYNIDWLNSDQTLFSSAFTLLGTGDRDCLRKHGVPEQGQIGVSELDFATVADGLVAEYARVEIDWVSRIG